MLLSQSPSSGADPTDPLARERPLRRRGLSLAILRPWLAPGQGIVGLFALPPELPAPVQASLPVSARAGGGSALRVPERSAALSSITRYDDGPAIRSRPIQFESTRVSLHATRLVRMPCRRQPVWGGAAATASAPQCKRAPHRALTPWLHAQWRGKEECEEGTTAWCPPRIRAGAGMRQRTTAVAARCGRSGLSAF